MNGLKNLEKFNKWLKILIKNDLNIIMENNLNWTIILLYGS